MKQNACKRPALVEGAGGHHGTRGALPHAQRGRPRTSDHGTLKRVVLYFILQARWQGPVLYPPICPSTHPSSPLIIRTRSVMVFMGELELKMKLNLFQLQKSIYLS